MHPFNVALLQLTACGNDQNANLVKGEDACRQVKRMGADLVLFPEMWNVGYSPFDGMKPGGANIWRAPGRWQSGEEPCHPLDPGIRQAWQEQAVDIDSQFISHFRGLARELNIAIALTYLEKWDGPPRNTLSLIDRHGEIVLTYAKVHTCDFDEPENSLTPGDGFSVAELDTARGPVQIGAMICYDREFPESARILMLQGAEIILTPNACELDTNRLSQFRARAFENMVGVAMANYAAPQHNGHSVAYHPIACDAQGNSRDLLVVEAGEQEGIHLAPFDLDEIRDYRKRETWGNAFRRPNRYRALVDDRVADPFIRVDHDGNRHDEVRR
jgi:N-carbamoylputrescine amidase